MGIPGKVIFLGHPVNTHSLVWNRFGLGSYINMLRYAKYDTDPHWSPDELNFRSPPPDVLKIQSDYRKTKCQQHNRSRPAAIRYSHCRKVLCDRHSLERIRFLERTEKRAGPSAENWPSHSLVHNSDDDDFDPDLFSRKTQSTTRTST